MTKERRLGRGLEALLGKPDDEETPQPTVVDDDGERVHRLDVNQIDGNPYQPREDFDEESLAALCENIQTHGLQQPIVVRAYGERYQLISGERRLRAAIKAGWADVPALVREVDDRQITELAIVENLQRKDLNPLEKAASFDRYLKQYECTQEELARRINVNRATIANLIRLLELPNELQDAVRGGRITQGHARALLPLGEEPRQIEFCRRIQSESLSVRATEELVRDTITAEDDEPLSFAGASAGQQTTRRTKSQHTASLEQDLRRALGTRVDIRQRAGGSGSIVIRFKNNEEFERLRGYITGGPDARLQSEAG